MTEIVIIKTVIGEEIIAELITNSSMCFDTDDSITVSRPRVFQLHQVNNQMKPSLVPWVSTDPDCLRVPMRKAYVATLLIAPNDLGKAYRTSVSGIALS